MPNQALYYPWIEIRDEQWLKTALLYWDELQTIVPESMENPYTTDTTQFLSDEGILSPIRVHSDMEEIEGLTDSVLTYLSSNEGARLVAANGNKESIIYDEKLPNKFEQFSEIYPEKLPYRIRKEFRQLLKVSNKKIHG
jgi:hypothetical protein